MTTSGHSSSSYESYLSNLDSLIFDSPELATQSEKDINEELALWSNTQFTFDYKTSAAAAVDGMSKEEGKSPEVVAAEQFEKVTGLDPVTYESLANYLDCELPRQQGVNLTSALNSSNKNSSGAVSSSTTTARRILPRPLAPAPAPAPVSPCTSTYSSMPAIAPAAPTTKRPILLPKTVEPTITTTTTSITATSTAAAVTTPLTTSIKLAPQKRARPLDDNSEDNNDQDGSASSLGDDDKRRRNTAASARFREKKKLREQAMEQSVREMALKSDKLQERVNLLEQEIKFLRDLLLNKVVAVKKQQSPTATTTTATATST